MKRTVGWREPCDDEVNDDVNDEVHTNNENKFDEFVRKLSGRFHLLLQ